MIEAALAEVDVLDEGPDVVLDEVLDGTVDVVVDAVGGGDAVLVDGGTVVAAAELPVGETDTAAVLASVAMVLSEQPAARPAHRTHHATRVRRETIRRSCQAATGPRGDPRHISHLAGRIAAGDGEAVGWRCVPIVGWADGHGGANCETAGAGLIRRNTSLQP